MAFFLQFDLQDHSIITLQLFWRGNRIDGYNVVCDAIRERLVLDMKGET